MIINDFITQGDNSIFTDCEALKLYNESSEIRLKTSNEPHPGYFIADGAKVIERALAAGYVAESFLIDETEYRAEAKALVDGHNDIPTYMLSHERFKVLTGYELTRGLLALMHRKENGSDWREIIKDTRRIAVLEDVMNPTNLGAIFRSAAALNIDAVLMTEGSTDPLYRRAARVSMGNVFNVPWAYFSEEESEAGKYVNLLREEGFATVAMALTDNTVSLDDPILKEMPKMAIILGTEGEGLSLQTITAADITVKIPMSHGVDSLNVAAASAVAFWELTK